MLAVSKHNKEIIQERIANGEVQGDVWDNAQMALRKTGEETLTNKKGFVQYTAGYIWFLNIPKPQEGEGWEKYGEAYQLLMTNVPGTVHIPSEVLYKEPDYRRIAPLDCLDLKAIEAMWPIRAYQGIEWVLRKHFDSDMSRTRIQERPIAPKTFSIYEVTPRVADIFAVPAMKLDESKIEDTGLIIEAFRSYTGVTAEQMLGRKKITAGDKGTNLKIKGLKKGRMRDFPENRLDNIIQWDGLLHLHMAIVDMNMRAHWGRTDGLDPASLCKFATVLGRSRVMRPKAEFNASRRFQRCQ